MWVSFRDKLVRYDWDTGKPAQRIPLAAGFGGLIPRGDELLLIGDDEQKSRVVTHLDLVTGQTRTEEIGETARPSGLAADHKAGSVAAAGSRVPASAGLPLGTPGADGGKPIDPAKAAGQAVGNV